MTCGPDGWSLLVWDPVETTTDPRDWPATGRRLLRKDTSEDIFPGGVVGYLGYGVGDQVERLPASKATSEPPLFLGRYEGALAWSAEHQRWKACGSRQFQDKAIRLLERAAVLGPPPPAQASTMETRSKEEWERDIRQILDWIGSGDCYQVNLSRVVRLTGCGEAFPAWRRLERLASASHGAFLRPNADVAILSSSPELFLQVNGRQLLSDPIKGTRPRHPDPVVDRAFANALRESEKDRAELTMIVDLVRNDLGRIAETGSVKVENRVITAHANVHHASQRVSATLGAGHDVWSALAATFPAGSVTGAPKIRACERIAELEPEPRGVYCGSIGFAADNGKAAWNVAIRTSVWTPDRQGTLRYHVGGGIVADSDPALEWRETIDKGTLLARAFTGSPTPELRRLPPASLDPQAAHD